jgi:hypothetical protein
MSGIKCLERAQVLVETKTPKTTWSTGHRLIFGGVLFIIVAIITGGLLWKEQTDPYANFTPENMQDIAEHLTPIGSWQLWQRLEKGGIEHHKGRAEIDFEDYRAKHQFLWWLWALIPITSLSLIAAGIIVLTLKNRKHRRL